MLYGGYTYELENNLKWRILKMEIKRIGSQPSGKGSFDYFTGSV